MTKREGATTDHGCATGLTTSFTVDGSVAEVFDAVLDVRGWWSAPVSTRKPVSAPNGSA